jgi:hypothetical protein
MTKVEFYFLLGNCASTTVLPNVKNVVDHCHGKMQNVLNSQVFQHWLSNVLEEYVHRRVCSRYFNKMKISNS